MQPGALAACGLVACLLVGTAAAGDFTPFEATFLLPSQASGAMEVEAAGTAILIMRDPFALSGQFGWPTAAEATLWTRPLAGAQLDGYPMNTYGGESWSRQDPDATQWARRGAAAQLMPTSGWVSVIVEADSIKISGAQAQASWLNSPTRYACASSAFPETEFWIYAIRWIPCGSESVLAAVDGQPAAVSLHAKGVRTIELMNVGLRCGGQCPTGGGYTTEDLHRGAANATLTTLEYLALSGVGGELRIENVTGRIAAIAPSYTGAVNGAWRLARATIDGGGLDVGQNGDQTIRLAGSTRFDELRLHPEKGDWAFMHGTGRWDQIRVDEDTSALPRIAQAAVAVGALAGLLGAIKLALGFLLTRDRETVMANARRADLLLRIEAQPGMSFRDILRETGWNSGSVRHHLGVMERAGVLVRRSHKITHRYFPAGHHNDWEQVVVLRQDALRQLWEWLAAHPSVAQKHIVETVQTWGWNRSTAQYRLNQLLDAGLVVFHWQGRYKMYSAKILAPTQQPAPPGSTTGAGLPPESPVDSRVQF